VFDVGVVASEWGHEGGGGRNGWVREVENKVNGQTIIRINVLLLFNG
jgi:hypothetical protein